MIHSHSHLIHQLHDVRTQTLKRHSTGIFSFNNEMLHIIPPTYPDAPCDYLPTLGEKMMKNGHIGAM